MAVIKCEMGHYYDNEKFSGCPHCEKKGDANVRGMEDSVTVAMDRQMTEEYAVQYVKSQTAGQYVELHTEKTHSDRGEQEEHKYIAGWLVCTEGPSEGKDYRLYAGFNRIGRGSSNDVVLTTDMQVTREVHCSIIYEEKKNVFYVMPQAGCLTYLGDEIVDQAVEISNGDVVKVGASSLELVTFCYGDRKWEKK